MNSTLQTACYGFFLILLFLGITAGIQSCGKKKDQMSLEDKTEEVADSYTSNEFFEDEDIETTSDEDDFESDDEELSVSSSTSSSTSSSSSSSPSTTSYTSSSRGDYLVVAGNYLLEDNANQMVRKLKNLGFSGAEKVVFDLSQYHTVLAGRYSSRSEASRQASSLQSKGVDNYVVSKN